jgi:hypothetical protein
MAIDYTAHAVVSGRAPMATRAGQIAAGELGKMIPIAVEHMAKGYRGVLILVGNETWLPDKIKAVWRARAAGT